MSPEYDDGEQDMSLATDCWGQSNNPSQRTANMNTMSDCIMKWEEIATPQTTSDTQDDSDLQKSHLFSCNWNFSLKMLFFWHFLLPLLFYRFNPALCVSVMLLWLHRLVLCLHCLFKFTTGIQCFNICNIFRQMSQVLWLKSVYYSEQ